MARRPRPAFARRGLAGALLLLALGGCANSAWQISAGGAGLPPVPPPPGASAYVTTTSAGALFALGLFGFLTSGGTPFYAVPPMDPARRVLEHDCTKPIEDPGANLRCR
jgi:hypothetical protein